MTLFTTWGYYFGVPYGAVWSNLVASAICFGLGYGLARWHMQCAEKGCYRKAEVPVKGTVHKICKHHAVEKGHTH